MVIARLWFGLSNVEPAAVLVSACLASVVLGPPIRLKTIPYPTPSALLPACASSILHITSSYWSVFVNSITPTSLCDDCTAAPTSRNGNRSNFEETVLCHHNCYYHTNYTSLTLPSFSPKVGNHDSSHSHYFLAQQGNSKSRSWSCRMPWTHVLEWGGEYVYRISPIASNSTMDTRITTLNE